MFRILKNKLGWEVAINAQAVAAVLPHSIGPKPDGSTSMIYMVMQDEPIVEVRGTVAEVVKALTEYQPPANGA